LVPAPRAESSTGTAEPTAMPIISGNAVEKSIAPVIASACKIPTVADALCKMQVNSAPAIIPSSGFEKTVSTRIKAGLSVSGATEPLIVLMPNISTAKPSMMSPVWMRPCFLLNMRRMIPIMEITPVSVAVDSSLTQPPPPPPRLDRQITQPVILVPIMEPRIMPMDCRNFIIPELTKPTTMAEVAEDDWITAVTPVPSRMPFQEVLVSL